MSLRLNAISGVRWTAFSAFGRAALQVLQIAVLARILSPQEFGVVAIGGSFYFFLQLLSDAGIGSSIINRQKMDDLELSNIYFLNLIVSGSLALLFACFAEFFGDYYKSDVLVAMIYVMAITLFVGAIGQPHRFLAHKRLEFSPVSKIDVCGAVFGLVATIGFALLEFGPLSVSLGLLLNAIFVTFFLWIRFGKEWSPSFYMSWTSTKSVIVYGAFVTGNNIFGGLTSQVDILIGGRLVGLGEMGGYSVQRDISIRVSNLVNQIVAQVGFPVMAKAGGDVSFLRIIYLKALRSTASINVPIYIFLSLFSADFTRVFLGSKWVQYSEALSVLCLWAILRSVLHPISSLVFSCGRGRLGFGWSLLTLLLIAPSVYFGSSWGAIGMAWALAFGNLILIFPSWFLVVRRLTECVFIEYVSQMTVPLVCGLISGLVSSAMYVLLSEGLVRFLSAGLAFLITYAFLSYFFNKEWLGSIFELVFKKRLVVK